MHPNPVFRKATACQNIEFARSRGFGILAIDNQSSNAVSTTLGPLLSHIPFVLDETGNTLLAHLVQTNPMLSVLENEAQGVMAVNGSDSYISPDWYQIENQVPTWNYVAVHFRGTVRRLPSEHLPDILDQLSTQFEQQLSPKPHWHKDKMDRQMLERMMKVIVPIAMQIDTVDGTWKLSQNKSDLARQNAAGEVTTDGIGSETQSIAALMRHPPC